MYEVIIIWPYIALISVLGGMLYEIAQRRSYRKRLPRMCTSQLRRDFRTFSQFRESKSPFGILQHKYYRYYVIQVLREQNRRTIREIRDLASTNPSL